MLDTTERPRQRVIIVGAAADDCVAGINGRLPWHAPDDLHHFRDLTLGHPVVMGQRTWQGLPRPLAGRRNIVLSGGTTVHATGALIATSLAQAFAEAGDGPVFVIGGRRPWEEALPLATQIHLTRIHARFPGDVYFPPIDHTTWTQTGRREQVSLVSGIPTRVEFLTFTRRDPTPASPPASRTGLP